jgi:hypothetical protein
MCCELLLVTVLLAADTADADGFVTNIRHKEADDGTGPDDRGVRFYFEWVRDNVGRWEFPRYVAVGD